MSRKPIEIMLDNVVWTPVDTDGDLHEGLPFVTHEGVLKIPNGPDIPVYQLSTGIRIITPDGLDNFTRWLTGGSGRGKNDL